MKQIKKGVLVFFFAFNICHAQSDISGHTFYQQRSAGSNYARWIIGQTHLTHLCDTEHNYVSFFLATEYQKTFDSEQALGPWFFFNGNNSMLFSGPYGGGDVFSRNFFLNDDFEAFITAKPESKNFTADFNYYLGLDEWVRGFYFRLDIPLNWISQDMRLQEEPIQVGTTIAANKLGDPNVYFSPPLDGATSPVSNIITAWDGQTLDPINFPDLKETMHYARINGKQTRMGIADINIMVGYDIWCTDWYHLGFNFQVIVPTGTRPNGTYVFEPIVGNGKHLEVGGGISAHCELWNNGRNRSFMIWLDGAAYHVFSTQQRRTFDLVENGVGSRYLLIKKFHDNVYAGEVLFGPNVLTRKVNVSNDIHGDAAIMLDYQHGGFTFDFGYNVWGRTKDNLFITEPIPPDTYGIEGNTDVGEICLIFPPFPPFCNPGSGVNDTQSETNIQGDFLPFFNDHIFISTTDLDLESARHPNACSQKFFGHLSYTWQQSRFLPFLGIGGEIEFARKNNAAFNQWGCWLKGGFTFF